MTDNKDKLLEHVSALKLAIPIETKWSLGYKIKDYLRILKRIAKPTGIVIAFLGPDGSGKSTIIDGLINRTLPYRKTVYFHLKPIVVNENKTHTATTNPHENMPYSKFKSYLKLLFFICQYNLGWLKNIWSLKVRSTLVIFDRYYDDVIVDHKRYRYGGSNKIAKLIRVFIPKPELYFVLTADAGLIYSRKQEVDFSELQTQIKNYNALTDGKRYYHTDVNNTPKDIIDKVCSILMKKMHDRY